MQSNQIPELPEVTLEDIKRLSPPSLHIRSDDDVERWKATKGYGCYMLFLHRLNESVVGHDLPAHHEETHPPAVSSVLDIMDSLDSWIDDIPPLKTPQRFGNLAFRSWGKRLDDNADDLLSNLLPRALHPFVPFLRPYLVTSFGNYTRMDYGTGHETAFGIFLMGLTLIRFLAPTQQDERITVFVIFERYLRLCWRLQDVYKLEPAGSHGVWGLDDYCFLPYIFGSGQLRDQTVIPVNAILRRPLPPTNLYNLSISRIHEVKQGPFFEHSPQLYSIAVGVASWKKVNSGLFKMYEAEVLGKRVVVQHLPLGGLMEWDIPVQPQTGSSSADLSRVAVPSKAPWATLTPSTSTSMSVAPSLPQTRVPWSVSVATTPPVDRGMHSDFSSHRPESTGRSVPGAASPTTPPKHD